MEGGAREKPRLDAGKMLEENLKHSRMEKKYEHVRLKKREKSRGEERGRGGKQAELRNSHSAGYA